MTSARISKTGKATRILCCLTSLMAATSIHSATMFLDLDGQTHRQVVVDRERGQYLGHPTTVLLEDGETILAVYPKGHGKGGIVYKRSNDGGLTWSERLPTPDSWATSREVPTLHRVVDASGKERLIMWSGLFPARLAVSEDDGGHWGELEPAGNWGGIVVMGFTEPIKTGAGHYLAMFHDDGRFFSANNQQKNPVEFKLYKTVSIDGGLSWSFPEIVQQSSDIHLCEPGFIRSPDGKQIAVLLRENSRTKHSHIIFSEDEGRTWSDPREMPATLSGDRHTGKYLPDGRLFISFRSRTPDKTRIVQSQPFDVPRSSPKSIPYERDWVGWIGTYDDLVNGADGQYFVRLKKNFKGYDCAYPGVEVLPNGTIVTTTYGHWDAGESPYILSVRLNVTELDLKTAPPQSASPAPAPSRRRLD